MCVWLGLSPKQLVNRSFWLCVARASEGWFGCQRPACLCVHTSRSHWGALSCRCSGGWGGSGMSLWLCCAFTTIGAVGHPLHELSHSDGVCLCGRSGWLQGFKGTYPFKVGGVATACFAFAVPSQFNFPCNLAPYPLFLDRPTFVVTGAASQSHSSDSPTLALVPTSIVRAPLPPSSPATW